VYVLVYTCMYVSMRKTYDFYHKITTDLTFQMAKCVGPLYLTGTLTRWTSTVRYQTAGDDITENSVSLKRR